ncbi:uncharacterized protein LOC132903552 [Amyelois transitella]|uniref:uncharacterized protein LOC132903552 n=1 Tax=Amyelois transitella TaxID=680683 RepID=UPI00298FF465|nr:uncharacterized protein LOC132903552 [Amyelois transitella]
MYSLYVDTAKNNVCHGCLSVDRNVTFLEANVGLFYSLLEQKHVFDTKIMLCWECKAFLRNTEKFQKRIQEAQCLLQDAVTTLNELCVNLSTLSYTKKDVYDHLIQYHDDKILQFENEPDHKEEPVNSESFNGDNEQTNIHIKQEVDDFNDTTYDNDYHSTDGEERIEVKESKKHINTYLDKVIITSTDIDSEDLKTYCCRVTLNDKEIDEMLDKSYRETQKSVTQRRPFKCKECKNEYKKELDYQRHYTFNHMKRSGRVTCKHSRVPK